MTSKQKDGDNFYDNWLNLWDRSVEERNTARTVIHEDELRWAKTRQDYKAALMVSAETGFRTWGTTTMIAEIPAGWHTGAHSHGEEAIYVIKGKGFSIIDDRQYEWEEGSCIHIPFGSVHQHFNDGGTTVRYLSAMCPNLEYFCGLAKFEQYEDCGKTSGTVSKPAPTGASKPATDRLLVLRRSEMKVTQGGEKLSNPPMSRYLESMGEEVREQMWPGDKSKGMHAETVHMMGSRPDFFGEEVEITHIFKELPGAMGGKHAHMEAVLYILEGEGYAEIDDKKIPWKTGSSLHVQGPQTAHQFFNTGKTTSASLRIHFGIRGEFFQPIAKKKFPYVFLEPRKDFIPSTKTKSSAAG